MSIDIYMGRRYDRRSYNCGHFVADVWMDLTGVDIGPAMSGLVKPTGQGQAILAHLRAFKRITKPISPCIAMLSPPRGQPHVGIFLRGRILHITESGVHFDHIDVACMGFNHARFYECKIN